MAVVLIAVMPPAFVVRLVRAVPPPTIPPNVVVPAVFTTRVRAPLTVLLKEMLPFAPPVEVKTALAPNVTASPYVCEPVVPIVGVLIAVLPAASVLRLTIFGPTTPPNVVVPPVFTAKLNGPSTVVENVTFPFDVEV